MNDDSFKEKIDLRAKGATAVFHKFRVRAAQVDGLHVFYEGYDDLSYFGPIAARHSSQRGKPLFNYVTLGKKPLDIIRRIYAGSPLVVDSVIFIRDRDFDVFVGRCPSSKELYITDGYSVENSVCTPDSVRSHLHYNFGIDPEEVDVDEMMEHLSGSIRLLFSTLKPICSGCFKAIDEGIKYDLNNADIESLFCKVLDGENINPADVMVAFESTGVPYDALENDERVEAYAAQDAFLALRGKFLMSCVALFLRREYDRLNKLYGSREITRFRRQAANDCERHRLFGCLAALSPVPTSFEVALTRALATAN